MGLAPMRRPWRSNMTRFFKGNGRRFCNWTASKQRSAACLLFSGSKRHWIKWHVWFENRLNELPCDCFDSGLKPACQTCSSTHRWTAPWTFKWCTVLWFLLEIQLQLQHHRQWWPCRRAFQWYPLVSPLCTLLGCQSLRECRSSQPGPNYIQWWFPRATECLGHKMQDRFQCRQSNRLPSLQSHWGSWGSKTTLSTLRRSRSRRHVGVSIANMYSSASFIWQIGKLERCVSLTNPFWRPVLWCDVECSDSQLFTVLHHFGQILDALTNSEWSPCH